jgi:hypothetical protein
MTWKSRNIEDEAFPAGTVCMAVIVQSLNVGSFVLQNVVAVIVIVSFLFQQSLRFLRHCTSIVKELGVNKDDL